MYGSKHWYTTKPVVGVVSFLTTTRIFAVQNPFFFGSHGGEPGSEDSIQSGHRVLGLSLLCTVYRQLSVARKPEYTQCVRTILSLVLRSSHCPVFEYAKKKKQPASNQKLDSACEGLAWDDRGYVLNPHCMEAGYNPAVIEMEDGGGGDRDEESLRPSLASLIFRPFLNSPPPLQVSVKATACSVEHYSDETIWGIKYRKNFCKARGGTCWLAQTQVLRSGFCLAAFFKGVRQNLEWRAWARGNLLSPRAMPGLFGNEVKTQ